MVFQWFYIPAEIARINGVLWKMLTAFTSAPLSRSNFTLFSRPGLINLVIFFISLNSKSKYLRCNHSYQSLKFYHVRLQKEVRNFYYYSPHVCLWSPLDQLPQLLWMNKWNKHKFNTISHWTVECSHVVILRILYIPPFTAALLILRTASLISAPFSTSSFTILSFPMCQ